MRQFFLLLCLLFFGVNATFATDDFTESLVNAQNDLSSGHMFFQLQTSMLTESFDNLMDQLGRDTLPYLGQGVDDFNDLHDTTEEALEAMTAHPSCFTDCDTIHLRYSREQARCARGMFYEMLWMMDYHTAYAKISEYYSNPVNFRGLGAFLAWRPLTAPDVNAPVEVMNRALRAHIDEYFQFDVAAMTDLADYLEDQFDQLSFTMYFCNYALLGRYYTASSHLLDAAANGQCSGQV